MSWKDYFTEKSNTRHKLPTRPELTLDEKIRRVKGQIELFEDSLIVYSIPYRGSEEPVKTLPDEEIKAIIKDMKKELRKLKLEKKL